MKILIMIATSSMYPEYKSNIIVLEGFMKELRDKNHTVDYCGISSTEDFNNYEDIISFKYKIITTKLQLSKIRDFIEINKHNLDYDWYVKFRPEIRLLQQLNFENYSDTAINARARKYSGPKKIQYGSCEAHHHRDYSYHPSEEYMILDDQIYIFHHNVIKNGGFIRYERDEWQKMMLDAASTVKWAEPYAPTDWECEFHHTFFWKSRNIPLNVVGINLLMTKRGAYSEHL